MPKQAGLTPPAVELATAVQEVPGFHDVFDAFVTGKYDIAEAAASGVAEVRVEPAVEETAYMPLPEQQKGTNVLRAIHDRRTANRLSRRSAGHKPPKHTRLERMIEAWPPELFPRQEETAA